MAINPSAAVGTQNQANRSLSRNNSSGYKGVSWERGTGKWPGKWRARAHAGGKEIHLGWFDTPEEAHAAYCAAANRFHGEFARFD